MKGPAVPETVQKTPRAVFVAVAAVIGFITAAAVLLWVARAPAILLDLKALSAAFICF